MADDSKKPGLISDLVGLYTSLRTRTEPTGVDSTQQSNVVKEKREAVNPNFVNGEEAKFKKIFELLGKTLEVGRYAKAATAKKLEDLTPSNGIGAIRDKVAGADSSKLSGGKGMWGMITFALEAIAKGIAAFANPATLLGLGAITLAIMGLAKAFEIASPGFEAFGKMLKDILKGAIPVIKAIGDAISTVLDHVAPIISIFIKGIGDIIGVIGKVIKDNEATVQKALDTIGGIFSSAFDVIIRAWDTFNETLQVVISKISGIIDSLGGAIKGIMHEAGDIIDTVGKNIIGTIDSIYNGISKVIDKIGAFRTSSMEATTSQIERLSLIPADKLSATAKSLKQITAALGEFGSETFVEAIRSGIGSLFGAESPIEKITALGKAAPGVGVLAENMKMLSEYSDLKLFKSIDVDAVVDSIEGINTALFRLTGTQEKLNKSKFFTSFSRIFDTVLTTINKTSVLQDKIQTNLKSISSNDEPMKALITDTSEYNKFAKSAMIEQIKRQDTMIELLMQLVRKPAGGSVINNTSSNSTSPFNFRDTYSPQTLITN